ncbi:hypothetical protein ACQEV4_20215 [Streptomyces shenzhenensis]|uniref:hypothetical protein n=1 Tax=Streptomyces shenzhenensis TaxID=943815 RepID=UPI003D92C318
MHSARLTLATAVASAAIVIAAPGAHASGGDEEGRGDSSYSRENGDDSGDDRPRGGMHTGGRVLAAAVRDNWSSDSGDDSRFDPETYKDNSGNDNGNEKENGSDGERNKDSWSDEDQEDRPNGGMHTGGGALAAPGVTAGGLAVLAFLGTGVYALRRKHTGGSAF